MDNANRLADFNDNQQFFDGKKSNASESVEAALTAITNGDDASLTATGLDMSTATEWIYPTNFPVRDYQRNIVEKALFQNTLVSLPTGLGKTFIAAVVMYNFNRWYPSHKVVFMAHSKPLVAQQVEACCRVMGIPQRVTALLTGNVASNARKQHWETKQIFFLTPQVFNNDLTRGLVPAESIRCVVVDEAHKALGNQAFCQAIRALQPFNSNFRVLALSATPGDDIAMVKSVIENLLISHLELRTEEDADIKKYLHAKKVETVVVSLDAKITEYKFQLQKVAEKYLQQLVQMKAISGGFGSLSSFSLVLKQKQFIGNPTVGTEQRGFVLSNFSIVISMYKALEELVIHGLRSFHYKLLAMKSGEGAKSNIHHRLAKDEEFLRLVECVGAYIGQDKDVAFDPDLSMARLQDQLDQQVIGDPPPVVYSHPKFVVLEEIITSHFDEWKSKGESTRVIVFCKSRPCTGEICNFLNRFRPLVKPMVLIGQSHTGSGSTSRGLKQSAQLEVMRKFRSGQYNTLVATCVGEEGLDVGEVDLIVNFDASRNSNTQVQRSGRTGRKRDGRVVNLVTEGKEYQDYNVSVSKSKNVTKKLCSGIKNLPLYPKSPRLLPDSIQPICQEMFLKSPDESERAHTSVPSASSISKLTSEKPERGNKKPNTSEDTGKRKKKAASKRVKKGALDCSMMSQATRAKYDIRYAMSKAQEKSKVLLSQDDTSDALFESMGAVAIFKDQAAKARKSPTESRNHGNVSKRDPVRVKQTPNSLFESVGAVDFSERQGNEGSQSCIVDNAPQRGKQTQLVCLEDSSDGFVYSNHTGIVVDGDDVSSEIAKEELGITPEAFRKLLSKPLDASVCDALDTLCIDDLVSLVSENLDAIRLPDRFTQVALWTPQDMLSSSEADDSMSDPVLCGVPLPASPHPRKDSPFFCDDDSLTDFRLVEPQETQFPQSLLAASTDGTEAFDVHVSLTRQPSPSKKILCEAQLEKYKPKCPSPESGNSADVHLEASSEMRREKFSMPLCPSPQKCGPSTEITNCETPVSNGRLNEGRKSPAKTPEVSMITVTQALALVASFKKLKEPVVTRYSDHTEKATELVVRPHDSYQKTVARATVNNRINSSSFVDAQTKDSPIYEERTRLNLPVCYHTKDLATESFFSQDFQTMNPSLFNDEKPRSPLKSLPVSTSVRNIQRSTTPSSKKFLSDDNVSPSLVSSGAVSKRIKNSKVKKSLNFHDPSIPPRTDSERLDLNSDDDLFAEVEKIKCTQNEEKIEEPIQLSSSPLTQVYSVSDLSPLRSDKITLDKKTPDRTGEWPPPRHIEKSLKTAVVRPLGFENVNSISGKAPVFGNCNGGWLSTENKPKSPTLLSLTTKKRKTPRNSNKTATSLFVSKKYLEQTSPLPCRRRPANDEGITSSLNNHSQRQSAPVNSSFSTFDCIPDDLMGFLDASPIKPSGLITPLQQRKTAMKQSTPLFGVSSPSLHCTNIADGELSDGALEAIRAVEEFEKAVRPVEITSNTSKSGAAVFDLWPSDDSGELFEEKPLSDRVRRRRKLSPKMKKKRRKKTGHKNGHPFIEVEAEQSGGSSAASSDDEDTSGLDTLDSSFLDERIAPTQAPNVDMTARYLASVKSPRVVVGAFKIPGPTKKNDLSVFSQVAVQDDDYCHDSFCVAEATDLVDEELSALEVAELALEKQKKKRRRNDRDSPVVNGTGGGTKKRRRIICLDSSSDDEVDVEKALLPPEAPLRSSVSEQKDPQSFQQRARHILVSHDSVTVTACPPLLLIGSRQIASAPEITITLRAKFKFRVEVRSCPGADFIVSWRLGINRVALSDFSNGAPAVKTALRESVVTLVELFMKPVVIVEDDKNKSAPRTAGCHRDMWMKHSAKRLARLHHAGVTTLFTRNRDETAQTVAQLAQTECDKGHGVVTDWSEITPQLETKLKFYTSLPGVNVALGLRLCRKFSTLASFLSTCDSVTAIRREVGVPQATAALIYNALATPPRS